MQPLYIVVEVLIGFRASADYSFLDSTVSDLGNTSCRSVRDDLLCSSWHAGMNTAFVWFGGTLALGALLWGSTWLAGRAGNASVALWCIAGLGSIGVGIFPVNEQPATHGLVALPIFAAQPAALLLMGISMRDEHPRLSRATYVVAAASAVGAAAFGVMVGDDVTGIGAVERLALWSGYIWVSIVALSSVVRRHTQDGTHRQV